MAFLNYTLIGISATITQYLLYILLVRVWNITPAYASVCGAMIGAIVAYVGNALITFSDKHTSRQKHASIKSYSTLTLTTSFRFFSVATASSIIGGLVVFGLTAWGYHYFLAQLIATAGLFPLTYIANERWTFAR